MPVRNGKWVSYAELQEEKRLNDGKAPGPAETNDTGLAENDKASRPKRSRSNAEAAIKDATGEDVPFQLPEGGKQWTEAEGEQAEADSRAHSGDTVYRDVADQIAGREDPIGTPAGSPIGALPDATEAGDADAGKAAAKAPKGTTTSKSLRGLSDASAKAPAKGSKASKAEE